MHAERGTGLYVRMASASSREKHVSANAKKRSRPRRRLVALPLGILVWSLSLPEVIRSMSALLQAESPFSIEKHRKSPLRAKAVPRSVTFTSPDSSRVRCLFPFLLPGFSTVARHSLYAGLGA